MVIIKKEPLVSLNQLKQTLADFKRKEREAISNYIPDPNTYKKWVESGSSCIYSFDTGLFILYDGGHMLETVFASKAEADIVECLYHIKNDLGKPIVVEHVFREGKDRQIGTPDCVLRRMSRSGDFKETSRPSECVEKAVVGDIPEIRDIFNDYFNPFTERIPDQKELERLVGMGGISIIRDCGRIAGMVIYEKSAYNIHLRYWWVSPSYRNRGVGGDLLRDYFRNGHECKRQFLWVFSDNLNAIEKYRHYGFEFDGTADEIYVIK